MTNYYNMLIYNVKNWALYYLYFADKKGYLKKFLLRELYEIRYYLYIF